MWKRPRRTKEDSVSTLLPVTKDLPGDYFTAVTARNAEGADTHLASHAPSPSRCHLLDEALGSRDTRETRRFRRIRRQPRAQKQAQKDVGEEPRHRHKHLG